MRPIFNNQFIFFALLVGGLSHQTPGFAVVNDAASDQHIREVVENLLHEKDLKIEQLETRIKQLESGQAAQKINSGDRAAVSAGYNRPVDGKEDLALPPGAMTEAVFRTNSGVNHATILSKLGDLGEEIAELKESAEEKGLDISGFFDVNAKTDNSTDQTFSIGSVELDLEYDATENLAASSAIVLCGNSAGVDFAAPAAIFCGSSGPGGLASGGAGIAVAFLDYHMFDHSIPPRGRILNNQGFHIQAGRFDIPFSTDYQNFANKDRVTVSAPITTSRMQLGGFNSEGVRSYGSWKYVNYSVFWTDAMFVKDGTSVGGRLGVALGQNNYRSHKNNPEGFEAGVSYLADLDKDYNMRHAVYGVDLSLGYSFLRLQNELMLIQAYNDFVFTAANGVTTDFGKPNQLGYHSTLLADLERFIDYPVIAFLRYGRWQPKTRFAEDFDGTLVSIGNISALTMGLNYRFNDYLKLKLEYTDSLGTSTTERFFDKKLGIAQMVVSF